MKIIKKIHSSQIQKKNGQCPLDTYIYNDENNVGRDSRIAEF